MNALFLLSGFVRKSILMIVGFCCFVFSAAAEEPSLQVFVSILPQVFFVEKVGGDRVKVEALVQPGASPATYDPGPRQMAALSGADVFFRIGVPFENVFMPKLMQMMPELNVVDTRQGIQMRQMKGRHHHEHDHNDQEHGGQDPHIWLDPQLVKVQAQTIADTLQKLDPDGAQTYKKNCDAFVAELDELDHWIAGELASVAGRTLMVFHPSWGYFADRYNLEQEAIELEGKEPGARQLARLMEQVAQEGVSTIFVQPQFSRASAQTIAQAIGGQIVVLDPLARDYISNLRTVTRRVRDGLGEQE